MRSLLVSMALFTVFAMTATAATTQPSSDAAKGTITGKVLHDGKPMGGIRVMVFSPEERKHNKNGAEEKGAGLRKLFGADRPKPIAQAVTDESGKFSIDVPAGKYVVAAMGRKIGAAHERVTVTEGQTAKVELQLQDRGGKKGKAGSDVPTTQA